MAAENSTTTRWDWVGFIHKYSLAELARGRRIEGVAAYTAHIRALAGFADGRAPSADLVADFVEHRAAAGKLSPSTLGAMISSLQSFANWASKRGYITEDIMRLVQRPRMPRRAVISAPRDQVEAAAAWMSDPDAAPGRSRRFAALCLYAGLRFDEARQLDWRDVDELAGEIVIREGKGGRSRRLPIAPPLARLLGEVPRPERKGAVAGKECGGYLSTGGAAHIFDRELARAGVTLSPHMLRRAFATRIDELGHSVRVIQELLGHSSLATTERYIGVDRSRKISAVRALDGAFDDYAEGGL